MSRIALYHLETLLWIARLGTFAAAADRLNTTQPSVSARIRELEQHVGIKLFRREGRRMLLTVKGRAFVQQCESIWSELQTILLSADAFSQGSGILRIGCGEIAAVLWLPALIDELKQALPSVTLEVTIDLTINLLQKLEAGLLDIALIVGPVETPLLRAHPIGRVAMAWYSSHRFEAKRRECEVDPEKSIWCLSRPSLLYQNMIDHLRKVNLSARGINTCNNVRTLIEIVSGGAGLGILPVPMAETYVRNQTLVPIEFDPPPAPVEFIAVMRRSNDEPLVKEVYRRISAVDFAVESDLPR